jgi:response regulator RpfG family c-di-GMP phosphodiesterase
MLRSGTNHLRSLIQHPFPRYRRRFCFHAALFNAKRCAPIPSRSKGGLMILLIGNDQEYAADLIRCLLKLRFSIVLALTEAEARERIGECLPDMIVLDADTRNGVAFDFLRETQNNYALRSIPVLIVSGDPPMPIGIRTQDEFRPFLERFEVDISPAPPRGEKELIDSVRNVLRGQHYSLRRVNGAAPCAN